MRFRTIFALVTVAGLLLAGCIPVPVASTATAAPTTISYTCPVSGPVQVTFYGSYVVLIGANGVAETYNGAMPTYFGNEASLTFQAGQSTMIWASLGEQETCTRGLG